MTNTQILIINASTLGLRQIPQGRNNKPVPVKITLNDQIPVSSNSGITVEPVELSGGKHNSQTGEIRWDLDINKQESRQIVLTYSVKYPKERTVILE